MSELALTEQIRFFQVFFALQTKKHLEEKNTIVSFYVSTWAKRPG
jgi:hypothetical protein